MAGVVTRAFGKKSAVAAIVGTVTFALGFMALLYFVGAPDL